jgi:hypothetical protein
MLDPGRRLFPNAMAAVFIGVDKRCSYDAECDAPPFCANVRRDHHRNVIRHYRGKARVLIRKT